MTTPKERAEHLVADIYAEGFDKRPLVEIITAEIRAAENEALERAANFCDEAARQNSDMNCAKAIRMMKYV